jgi:RNA-splicing ligase RtcB|tara:strand:+ start:180 stop:449 length:270 start_codon:yes stop_codon:yes gene_type:complete
MARLDYDKVTREFLSSLQENKLEEVGIREYIQALSETLNYFKPRTLTEKRRLAVAKQQLKEIRRHSKRLQEKLNLLEEKVNFLEENKDI